MKCTVGHYLGKQLYTKLYHYFYLYTQSNIYQCKLLSRLDTCLYYRNHHLYIENWSTLYFNILLWSTALPHISSLIIRIAYHLINNLYFLQIFVEQYLNTKSEVTEIRNIHLILQRCAHTDRQTDTDRHR